MNMRSSNNPYSSFSEATDKRIGDAYPVIQAVHAKLADITYIAENAENIQPGQIELRYVEETNTIEWKYTNLVDWNILVAFPDYLGAADELLVAADMTAADRASIEETVAFIKKGAGSPEGSVSGSVGAMYLRTDGGTSTTLYIKESGAGTSTGWVAK